VWEHDSRNKVAVFVLDRGVSPRRSNIEALSDQEHIAFVKPERSEVLLDAGCGTGVNILRFYPLVKRVIGMDFASGSVERCLGRIGSAGILNSQVCVASLTDIPLPDHSVDRILCLSVLQYLDDDEVRRVLREFVRVLAQKGTIILHVKNSLSLYWSTLRMAKRIKVLLKRPSTMYHIRPLTWYANELSNVNCRIADYKAFNLLTVDRMPTSLVWWLQECELKHQDHWFYSSPVVKKYGADLKIRAVPNFN
jgi:ubiquinone/menaquinone biosynthesis C-methylase UbiE